MTAEALAALAGVLLSLLFRYVPGFAPWFEAKTSVQKAAVQAGLTAGATLAIFGLSCAGQMDAVTCDSGGVWELLELLAKAIAANQVTHVMTNPARPYKVETGTEDGMIWSGK
jgi:hypothetical protein